MSDPLWERVLVASVGPLLTVTLGLLVLNQAASWAQRRKDAAETRESLATELTEAANAMYFDLQTYWRAVRDIPIADRVSKQSVAEPRVALDKKYQEFQPRAHVLDRRLRIYFRSSEPPRYWHSVVDLLTVRYFLLWEPDDARRRAICRKNTGPDHSGLSEGDLLRPAILLQAYHATLESTVGSLWQHNLDRLGKHLKLASLGRLSDVRTETEAS